MGDLILTTFDWVPDAPRGYVRDLRVRWALEESGLTYRVQSVPFGDRNAEHFAHQPFGQVPWLTDGGRLEHVVRTRMFVTNIGRFDEIGRAHGEVFSAIRLATSMVEVWRLVDEPAVVEIEADAVVG
jgi:hypothetical protein